MPEVQFCLKKAVTGDPLPILCPSSAHPLPILIICLIICLILCPSSAHSLPILILCHILCHILCPSSSHPTHVSRGTGCPR